MNAPPGGVPATFCEVSTMATTKKGKKATSFTVRKVVKRKKPYASMTRKKGGGTEIKLSFK